MTWTCSARRPADVTASATARARALDTSLRSRGGSGSVAGGIAVPVDRRPVCGYCNHSATTGAEVDRLRLDKQRLKEMVHRQSSEIGRLEDDVETLREALQEIRDMGRLFGREGDQLAEAQRISGEALSGRYPELSEKRRGA
jgi:hypothetical protein